MLFKPCRGIDHAAHLTIIDRAHIVRQIAAIRCKTARLVTRTSPQQKARVFRDLRGFSDLRFRPSFHTFPSELPSRPSLQTFSLVVPFTPPLQNFPSEPPLPSTIPGLLQALSIDTLPADYKNTCAQYTPTVNKRKGHTVIMNVLRYMISIIKHLIGANSLKLM
jgi:hypothetical protein